ncbi:MAG: DUF2125 domain-containing protein [Pseudomonadota bacterium]|uniref:DUF2125 domain-containing protein n=1 Tax=Roseovarius TaxID=74030 RepID=UPI0022A8AEEA|nr:DUF2125 domain-containing protein [Roseovarius sp. EGI FJ00037]MCZ0812738.1 DUF2125 domain-containing protein [Roseovarius sp. EGI FJ00037]
MTFRIRSATALAALSISISGSAAFADVTPEQVWQGWQDYLKGFGYSVEANETRSGDTLTVSDIALLIDMPEDQGSASITIDQLRFTENGDGSVQVSFPETMPMVINGTGPEGEEVRTEIDYRTSGFEMSVAGDPDDMTYDYSAGSMTLALAGVESDGKPMDIGTASMTASNVAGTSRMISGDLRDVTQTFSAGPVTYTLDVTDPEEGGQVLAAGGYESMRFEGTGTLPQDVSSEDMAAMLEAGFTLDGRFSFENGTSEFSAEDNDAPMKGRTQSRSGALDLAMNQERLHYGAATQGLQIELESAELPFPVELAMETLAIDLMAPVSKGEEPQDFAAAFRLTDFTMSEMLWAMFDPGQELPRDPATLVIDLSGKAKLLFDLLDPEQIGTMEVSDAEPGELNALTLNDLTLRLAGAELTGGGDFTFDNDDLESFDGMPAPEGTLDLRLMGGNSLLDKLIAIGILPEEQASGMRMMMGLFARPGEAEDELVSTIEVNADGQVLANGQRIK